jgi:transposase
MKKHVVELSVEQRERLRHVISSGSGPARGQAHARVLLKAGDGETDQEVAESVEVSVRTVERVRKLFATGGLDAALGRRPQPPRPAKRKLDGAGEAHLVALACSEPPQGRPEWTLRLLAGRAVELKYAEAVSYETVRRVLKKVGPSRG